jgi:Alcohol acetyltransferase
MTARYELAESLLEFDIKDIIFSSLGQLINRHPVMGISLIREDSLNPSWIRLRAIDLEKVVHFCEYRDSKDFNSVIEKAHQTPFDHLGELPLWRVVVFQHPERGESKPKFLDMGFFFHHGVGDGGSGVAFHLELLDILNTLQNVDYETTIAVPTLDMLPSIEEAHQLPLSIYFILSQIAKSFLPHGDDKLCWTGSPISYEPNIAHLRTLFLPYFLVDSILQLCRDNGVTVTALISVLIARALATNYPEYERFSSTTAMSFRRFTGTSKRAMVVYVSSFTHRFSTKQNSGYLLCSGEFDWDAVKSCTREIKEATSSPKNQQVGLLKFLNNYGDFLRKKVGKKREWSFEVSNVGIMDGNREGPFRAQIKRILFSQSRNVTGAALVFSLATAKKGDMAIGLTWQDGVVEIDLAEKVLGDLEMMIRNLVSIKDR